MSGDGQEILIIDGDPKVQRGMEQLFRTAGLQPTIITDPWRAIEMAGEKFFSVAVVDLDTPEPEGGLKTLAALREKSPRTALVALSPRRSFDSAVAAFRGGVDDVVVKTPEQVEFLRNRVVQLAAGRQRTVAAENLVGEAADFHDDLMKVLLETFRRVSDLEEQQASGDVSELDEVTSMLLVEDDGWLTGQLGAMLDDRYDLKSVSSGAEALDQAGRESYQVVLVKESLPDLPGSMVVRTLKSQSSETMVLLFSSPQPGRPGRVEVIESSRAIPFIEQFTQAKELAERIDEVREAFRATSKERKYLAAFRQHHFDLLKRFAELKAKMARAK